MQYDFNKALYTLKKMIKNADMEVLNYPLAERALVEMVDYAGEVGLLPVKLSLSHCLTKILYRSSLRKRGLPVYLILRYLKIQYPVLFNRKKGGVK